MRNYTGIAVWGCLLAFLALEFIDFGSSPKAQTAKSEPIQLAPAPVPAMVPGNDKARVAKTGAGYRRGRENVHVPFSHIRDKRDGYLSYRQ
jgi:hypothetical protein